MKKKKDPVKEYLRQIGSKGGKKAAEGMSAEERKARAKKAVDAREEKRKRKA
jgi:hypothetical protein